MEKEREREIVTNKNTASVRPHVILVSHMILHSQSITTTTRQTGSPSQLNQLNQPVSMAMRQNGNATLTQHDINKAKQGPQHSNNNHMIEWHKLFSRIFHQLLTCYLRERERERDIVSDTWPM